MSKKRLILCLCLIVFTACAQHGDKINLGRLQNEAMVSFIRSDSGDWGIEISGVDSPFLLQHKPAQIEIFRDAENVRLLSVGYLAVKKDADGVLAQSTVSDGGAVFDIEDRWTISDAVLSLNRTVSVTGGEDNAGFYSAIRLSTAPTVTFFDVDFLAPGLLYGDPTYDGERSPGGLAHYRNKRFTMREDMLSAPLFALSFRDGNWAAVLDLAPRGDTTVEESTAPASTPIIDERILFGALGAHETADGGVEFGFWMPGTVSELGRGFQSGAAPVVRRRYHPVKEGFSHNYQVGFRFGQGATFTGLEREAWRWAWETLKPEVETEDIELVRTTLTDHLADRVLEVGDMAGIPFLFDAVTGAPGSYRSRNRLRTPEVAASEEPWTPAQQRRRNMWGDEGFDTEELAEWANTVGVDLDPNADELILWPKIIMSFVCKGIESADQLLIESDRDSGPRGQRMRELGMKIIDSYIRLVPMSPPAGEGFNLQTGKADCRDAGVFTLRAPSDDMRILMDAYRREKRLGRDHPEWVQWCRDFVDWLIPQQRNDGSFPRVWNVDTHEVTDAEGTSSYEPVPLFVRLSEETGDSRYLESAIRAADYVWYKYGSHGVFVGGATDNPNITDKEAGMLTTEAYLSLYETTQESKWLERAKTAGNYTETWIWIWNLPMPMDAYDGDLHWKKGISTVGAQGITAQAAGAVDQYLAWGAPAFAKLYKYTGDEHYLDVTRILLHGTKSMLPLPGRTFDLLGPGWQQEHWRMGPSNRGIGGHRSWLPWVSVNHLHGITGIEELDSELYRQLVEGN